MRTLIRPSHLLVALLMVLSACGSTLQPSPQQVSAGGDGRTGESTPTHGAESGRGTAETTSGVDSANPANSSGQGPGALSAGTQATAGPETPGTAPATTQPEAGPQGDAGTEPVRVGIVSADVAALFAVFGADDKAPSDPHFWSKPFVEYINKTGGISGRELVPEYIVVDIAADYNAEGQRVCETFTQDRPVDVVIDPGFSNEVMHSCLGQHGIAVFDGNRWVNDRSHTDLPNRFTPLGMRVDRYTEASIELAVEQGVLSRGDKLGVLYEDCPWGRRVYENVAQPAAERHGVATTFATVKCIENLVSDLGPVTNQSRSAALRFRSEDVTHVLTLSAAEGFIVGQFSQGASDQRWYPNYLITSNGWPFNNADPDAAVHFAPDALENMSGIGFVPRVDVGSKAHPADDAQAAVQAECKQADPTMGGADSAEEGNDKESAMAGWLGACDLFFLLRNVLETNGVSFAIPDVAVGYATTLTSDPSALLAGGRFGLSGDRRDAVGFVQPLAYDQSGGRFMYSGQPRQVL